MMIKEAEIRTFIEGATNYFEVSAQQSATVGSPYLVTDGNPGAYEYTGVIGISGARKGIVYFTAPRGMLTVLLMRMQETDTHDEDHKGLLGRGGIHGQSVRQPLGNSGRGPGLRPQPPPRRSVRARYGPDEPMASSVQIRARRSSHWCGRSAPGEW